MYSDNGLETEQLYQETYQIKKVIKQLEKQLDKIARENHKRDKQFNDKENLINDIIINNNMQFNDEEDNKTNYHEMKFNRRNSTVAILMLKIKREIKSIINEIY